VIFIRRTVLKFSQKTEKVIVIEQVKPNTQLTLSHRKSRLREEL